MNINKIHKKSKCSSYLYNATPFTLLLKYLKGKLVNHVQLRKEYKTQLISHASSSTCNIFTFKQKQPKYNCLKDSSFFPFCGYHQHPVFIYIFWFKYNCLNSIYLDPPLYMASHEDFRHPVGFLACSIYSFRLLESYIAYTLFICYFLYWNLPLMHATESKSYHFSYLFPYLSWNSLFLFLWSKGISNL